MSFLLSICPQSFPFSLTHYFEKCGLMVQSIDIFFYPFLCLKKQAITVRNSRSVVKNSTLKTLPVPAEDMSQQKSEDPLGCRVCFEGIFSRKEEKNLMSPMEVVMLSSLHVVVSSKKFKWRSRKKKTK